MHYLDTVDGNVSQRLGLLSDSPGTRTTIVHAIGECHMVSTSAQCGTSGPPVFTKYNAPRVPIESPAQTESRSGQSFVRNVITLLVSDE